MIELRYLIFERWLSQRAQLVLVNSRGIRDELIKLGACGRSASASFTTSWTSIASASPSDDERRAARARHGIPDGARVLVMPGRLSIQKHQIGLMLALLRLAKSGRLPDDVVLLMPGPPQSRAGRPAGQAPRPAPRAAAARLRLIGTETDMRELYWGLDLLVLFSLWEGLPNVALEACASGLPALLSHAANLDGIVAAGRDRLGGARPAARVRWSTRWPRRWRSRSSAGARWAGRDATG
jgi:glycosyltransferase involved in cell wall biosynthesis